MRKLIKLLQDELGYTLIKQELNPEGKQSWTFKRNGVELKVNQDNLEEHYSLYSTNFGTMLLNAEKKLNEDIKKNPLILGKKF